MTNSVAAPNKGPVIAFLVVLLIGILIAAFLFRDMFQKSLNLDNEGLVDNGQVEGVDPGTSSSTSDGGTTGTNSTPEMGNGTSTTGSQGTDTPYMTDSVLVTDLADALKNNDLAKFIQVAGPDALPSGTVTRLRSLVDGGFSVDPKNPVSQVPSADGNTAKWIINLIPPTSLQGVGPQTVDLNLTKDPARGWSVAMVEAPDLKSLVAQMEASKEAAPLQVARDFLSAVIARDFKGAKALIDTSKLSEEKLAALFIVVEEGAFKEKEDKPLLPTVVQDTTAWIIARLQSAGKNSEFGIEMARADKGQDWKVASLNFDQLMTSVAKESGAGDIAYSQIITDVRAGDSLVLFFEFDSDSVNARAKKQLEILARILKEDPKRVLHINGHTDAKGDENYNESLSSQRAQNVQDALVGLGVPSKQVQTKAFGESAPKAPNLNPDGTDNPNGRAQNRRAEVYLQF